MAATDRSSLCAIHETGQSCGILRLAVDCAYHLEVFDCCTFKQNKRSVEPLSVLTYRAGIVGKRVHASTDGAAKWFVTCANADALGIDVGCHLKKLAAVALASDHVVGQLLPVGTVLNKVGIGTRSTAVPSQCPLYKTAQEDN